MGDNNMEKSKIALIIGVALLVIGMFLTQWATTSAGTYVTILGFIVSVISVFFFIRENK